MKSGSFLERMKTKNFYIVIGLIVITSGTLWLLNYPSTTFQSIVTKTHKGIKNLPNNIQIQSSRELTVNSLYLSPLGLDPQSVAAERQRVWPTDDDGGGVGKVAVGSSVEGGQGEELENALVLMESVAQHMAGHPLVLFDLTASETTHTLLKKYCNSSWNCEVRRFEFDKYPSHVADLSLKSYRPICIQEMLNTYRWVVWADEGWYLQGGANLTRVLRQAREVGVVAWSVEDPTSALTHPKVFPFFKTRQELFYFHRAVQASHLVLARVHSVVDKVMLPWVKCALLEECINPTGAQHVGCNFLRKPLFKYSGCHFYDMSALNVILGPLFDFDERAYTTREPMFGSLEDDRLAAKNMSLSSSSSSSRGGGSGGGGSRGDGGGSGGAPLLLRQSPLRLREYLLNGKGGESVAGLALKPQREG